MNTNAFLVSEENSFQLFTSSPWRLLLHPAAWNTVSELCVTFCNLRCIKINVILGLYIVSNTYITENLFSFREKLTRKKILIEHNSNTITVVSSTSKLTKSGGAILCNWNQWRIQGEKGALPSPPLPPRTFCLGKWIPSRNLKQKSGGELVKKSIF